MLEVGLQQFMGIDRFSIRDDDSANYVWVGNRARSLLQDHFPAEFRKGMVRHIGVADDIFHVIEAVYEKGGRVCGMHVSCVDEFTKSAPTIDDPTRREPLVVTCVVFGDYPVSKVKYHLSYVGPGSEELTETQRVIDVALSDLGQVPVEWETLNGGHEASAHTRR